ncbi:MAG: hypothetical protein HUJ25_11805 [Crocinitomicaceae bacterium]|nr:hypothetical protein [Crocinitomicaceae bacterium]
MRKVLVLLALIQVLVTGYAGHTEYSIRKDRSEINVTDEISIKDPSPGFSLVGTHQNYKNYGKVTLKYNRENHSDISWANEWRYSVVLNYFEGTNEITPPITLSVSSENSNYIYSDYYLFDDQTPLNAERKIKIVDIIAEYFDGNNWITVSDPQLDGNIPPDIHLEVAIKTERYYELDETQTHRVEFNDQVQELRWPFIQGAESYDIEWVFIDKYSSEYGTVNDAITNATTLAVNPGTEFSDNYSGNLPFNLKEPTRVNTKSNHYVIDMIFPEGTIYFRMRPVGRHVLSENPNNDFESIKNGAWTYSTVYSSTGIPSENEISRFEVTTALAFATDQNWLYGIQFAEDGKNVSTLAYFDGAYRVRQSLAYNSTDNITLVGESKYDYEGRQSVNIIPAPVNGRDFSYKDKFNESVSNVSFEKDDFDIDSPQPLYSSPSSTTKGSAQYYSPDNTLTSDPYRHAIPDASGTSITGVNESHGFTYSQVRYNKDGTGRISETSSPGYEYRMDGGRTTKYFYGTTNEVEVKRLFGKEAGEINNYKKMIVVDVNDQASVNYYDNHGRVIASGLVGEAPDNLVQLDDFNVTSVTTALSTNNQVNTPYEQTSREVIINYVDAPPYPTYTFTYDFDGVLYGVYNPNPSGSPQLLCFECQYEFQLQIIEPDGDVFYDSGVIPFSKDGPENCGPSNGAVNYDPSNGTLTPNPSITLTEQGEYEVIKTLRLVTQPSSAYQSIVEAAIGTQGDYINGELLGVDISGCFDDCNSFCDHVAGIQYELDNPGQLWENASQIDIDTYMGNCLGEHCDINIGLFGDGEDQYDITNGEDIIVGTAGQCEGIKLQMIDQVSPGGYEYETAFPGSGTDFWDLIDLDVGTTLLLYTADDINQTNPMLSVADIKNNWEPQWAEQLLPYHREYCHFKVCLELDGITDGAGNSSLDFDILMMDYGPWADYTANLLNEDFCVTTLSPDPYAGSSIDNLTPVTLQTALSNYTFDCNAGSGNPGFENLNDYVADFWTCNSIPGSDAWNVFYGQYQQVKHDQIDSYKLYLHNQGTYLRGCDYYSDEYAIVQDIAIEDQDNDGDIDSDDFVIIEAGMGGPGVSYDCADMCTNQVQGWLDQMSLECVNQIGTTTMTTLEGYFNDYCSLGCAEGNVGGWFFDPSVITGASSAWITSYNNIEAIFTDPANDHCNLSAIEVTTGTFSMSTQTVNIENSCLQPVIDEINANGFNSLGFQTFSLPTGTYCVEGSVSLTGTNNETIQVATPCATEDNNILTAVKTDGVTPIDLNTVQSITDIVVSQVSIGAAIATVNYFSGSSEQVILFLGRCFESTTQTIISYTEPTLPDWTTDCINEAYAEAYIQAQTAYGQLYDSTLNVLLTEVDCMTDIVEDYTMTYDLTEYQYTLYYYDQVGNLVSTVPPEGVDILPQGAFTNGMWDGFTNPNHRLQTLYEYNGANELVKQTTPDGGETNYYYDDLFRLRFSQNAQQALDDKFSYTIYDELGRITEAGEAGDGDATNGMEVFVGNENDYSYPPANIRRDRVETFYEEGFAYGGTPTITSQFSNGQENLRNRIGAVVQHTADYEQTTQGATTIQVVPGTYIKAISSYSYDFHGNVKELVQTNDNLDDFNHQHKRFRYDYDLISGNVNEVVYQEGEMDEWRHKYHYDANNRLVRAFTSDEGEEWEMEAKYFYYLHGSLARVERGHDKVQGTDYIYNLQGWLKGANSTTLKTDLDAGNDAETGDLDQYSGADAFGFSLSYFANDYNAIGGTAYFADQTALIDANTNSGVTTNGNLYNGNITAMVTAMKDVNESQLDVLGNVYEYDQLQRITRMDVYNVALVTFTTNNSFNGAGLYNPDNGISAYATRYSYDGNGNLRFLQRYNETAALMDDFEYHYNVVGSNIINNRLKHVTDLGVSGASTVDIENQNTDNYRYNAIGQLASDDGINPADEQEGIADIEWTATGKVKKIKKTSGEQVEFVYDAMGNRIIKVDGGINHTESNYTYYVYDASGNVITTYERLVELPTGVGHEDILDQLSLGDQMIYGAKRLGVKRKLGNRVMADYEFTTTDPNPYNALTITVSLQEYPENFDKEPRLLDQKSYELANHLGNVLAVVSDRKIPDAAQEAYEADIISYSDYYPFGMQMSGRNGTAAGGEYRYSFQGQEKDDEIKGPGNSINYKYRMHDPRLGRFFAIDPLTSLYPHYSPYQFSGNKVIQFVELEGLEEGDPNEEQRMCEGCALYKTDPDVVEAGVVETVPVTYYPEYSEEFNALSENNKNFLVNKYNSMPEGNYYRKMLAFDMIYGTDNYGIWVDDYSGWWGAGADKAFKTGWQYKKGSLTDDLQLIVAVSIGGTMVGVIGGAWLAEAGPALGGVYETGTSIYASGSDLALYSYISGESAVSSGVNVLSKYWLGRMSITGTSLILGNNLWNYRTGAGVLPSYSVRRINNGFILRKGGTPNNLFRFQYGNEWLSPLKGNTGLGSEQVKHLNFTFPSKNIHVILEPKRWGTWTSSPYNPFRIGN